MKTLPQGRHSVLMRRVFGGVCVGTLGSMALFGPAWAHVTVHPSTLPAGSNDVELTFRVPNERANANTVTVEVIFPASLPLLTVDVLPVAGWTATVRTQSLATPVQTDDGPVSSVVSDVTWTASGAGIAAGQYEDFAVAVGSLPSKPAQLIFKALQTYSSGEVVRWIELPLAGQPEPDFPAPVLTLTPATPAGSTRSGTGQHSAQSGSSTTDAIAIAALVLAGLNTVGLALVLARSRRGGT